MIAKSQLKAEPITIQQIKRNKKIEIITKNIIKEIKGDKFVKEIILEKAYKGKKQIQTSAIFVDIGHIPLSGIAKEIGVKLTKNNQVIIDKESKTNLQGIYAAGDVTDTKFKQAITGVGEAVKAVYSAYEYINKEGPMLRCAHEQ